jgi:hypothetical protein
MSFVIPEPVLPGSPKYTTLKLNLNIDAGIREYNNMLENPVTNLQKLSDSFTPFYQKIRDIKNLSDLIRIADILHETDNFLSIQYESKDVQNLKLRYLRVVIEVHNAIQSYFVKQQSLGNPNLRDLGRKAVNLKELARTIGYGEAPDQARIKELLLRADQIDEEIRSCV